MPPEFWTAYWGFVSFAFGAIVGSFLNVCIWRLPRGESVVHPPSHCPACNHRLRLLPDMVPVLSQLWYRSRCRYCGERFSWRYLWVELATAVLFLAIYWRYAVLAPAGTPEVERIGSSVLGMLFAAALVVVFFIDLEHYVIPDIVVAFAALVAVAKDALLIAVGSRPLWWVLPGTDVSLPLPLSVTGGLLAFWLLWQFAALSTALLGREAMGAGDSLLLAAMGAFLVPWPLVLVAFLCAVALGSIGGVVGMVLAARAAAEEGRAGVRSPAPGPEEPEPGVVTAASEAECPPPPELSCPPNGEPQPPAPGTEPVEALQEPAAGPEIPRLPPASRWGRLVTVAGTWLAVGGLWLAVARWNTAPAVAVCIAGGALLAAAVLLVVGTRRWVAGDREWLPQMDAVFEEGDPGPRFVPFGPYLVIGTLLAMLAGRQIVEWYALWNGLDVSGLPWE